MIASLIIIWTFIFITYWYMKNYWIFRTLAKNVNCPLIHPLFGNLFLCTGGLEDNTKKMICLCEKNPNRFGVWKGPYFTLYLFNPTDVETVLTNTKEIDKPYYYKVLRDIAGSSSLTMPWGPVCRLHKRLSTPWFQVKNLKNIAHVFNDQADDLVKAFEKKVGREFDAKYDIGNAVMASLAATVVGVDKKHLEKDALKFTELVENLAEIATEKMMKLWLQSDLIFYILGKEKRQKKYKTVFDNMVIDVITQRKKIHKQEERSKVFVDELLEAKLDDGSPFPDTSGRDELKTMLLAGHSTTISSLGFFLSLMGLHKEIQEKVYEEVTSVLGGNLNRRITYEDLRKFEYMDRVLQETWRLYSPAAVIPKIAKQDVQLGNLKVPAGTDVVILPFALHRNPNVFKNPTQFDPDNFLPENIKKRHPYSFVPFSGGNRTCLGKQFTYLLQKIYIARIVQNFKIHSNVPEKDYRLSFEITLTRKEGFLIVLEQRNKTM